MKTSILIIIITILSSIQSAYAKYTQTCTIKYATESGWSKNYTVDVTFISGSELNDVTKSYNYSSYSVYAVIFWGKDQASVIKLSSYLLCGTEVDKSCITNSIYDLKGTDQDGDEWNICVTDYCF